MFYGVLEMPYEMAMEGGEIAKLQFYNRVQEAVSRLKVAEAALAKQVPAQEQDKIDAQRYRFLRHADLDAMRDAYWPNSDVPEGEEFDRCVDAAQLAQSADKAEGE